MGDQQNHREDAAGDRGQNEDCKPIVWASQGSDRHHQLYVTRADCVEYEQYKVDCKRSQSTE